MARACNQLMLGRMHWGQQMQTGLQEFAEHECCSGVKDRSMLQILQVPVGLQITDLAGKEAAQEPCCH